MKNNKLVFYWSPHIDNVATVKAAYNSALALNKYSNSGFKAKIIDVFGEWKNSRYFEIKNEIFLKLNYISFLHKFSSKGFIKSRIKYFIIFCFNFFNLKNLIEKEKPDYLIIHLVTSLPLILNLIFNFNTKLILRISGKPKLNFFRYLLWKICLKKVFKVTCPTIETFELLKKMKLIDEEKLKVLYDPILNLKDINSQKKNHEVFNFENKKFFLAIGRLTKQKNFEFLIKCFEKILIKEKDLLLIIIGTGEDEDKLKNFIKKKKLQNNIFLIGYKNNVFKYFEKCEAFILSSLWEDPGFVIIEAMFSNCFVLSSDCPSGPKEIIGKNNGILFKNNSIKDFLSKYGHFKNLSNSEKKKIIINSKKSLKKFTLIGHYNSIVDILKK
tara:strand:- start:4845 stop:5996 length:1152 start_codon:yes stop_codon:yes gene_type:complete